MSNGVVAFHVRYLVTEFGKLQSDTLVQIGYELRYIAVLHDELWT